MKTHVRWLSRLMLIAGFLLLSFSAAAWVFADGFQSYQNWLFDRSAADPSANEVRPLPHSVIGRIEIPRLDLSAMIVEGVQERDLFLGVGHIPGTALPGENGNVVLAAHRDTFFRPLRRIAKNDRIVLTTLLGASHYTVDSIEITNSDDSSVLRPSSKPTLTLITCYPFSFVGAAPNRFVVHARKDR
jgi:sortase A